MQYINPVANRLLPSASETIRQHTLALMHEGKIRLRHILATAISDVHITCDMWTSPNHLGILAVVAHFTSEKLRLITATLAVVKVEGEHSGANLARIVERVVDDFGIRPKLGYFVMDNATSNDQLVQTIARSINNENTGLPWNPEQRRLRCNGHVINLVIQAFLFGAEQPDHDKFNEDEAPSEE